jgi:hypothetical protein
MCKNCEVSILQVFKDSVYTIYCDSCNYSECVHKSDGDYRKSDTPYKYFKRNGWEGNGYITICKNCSAKNKLKTNV